MNGILHTMNGRVAPSPSHSISINEKLDAISSSPPKHTIFKVHELARRGNPMAYEPEILAIGPYHRGKERLLVMEDWKLRWFKSILERKGERDATKYVEAMKSLEPKARKCYSESISNLDADQFAEMLLLDGCFISELFRLPLYRQDNTNDPFFKSDWIIGSLFRDVLLFENQIPLFVVEELFYLTKLPNEDVQFLGLASAFLETYFGIIFSVPMSEEDVDRGLRLLAVNDVPHLLGLLHQIYCPPIGKVNASPLEPTFNSNPSSHQNATKSYEAGSKFITIKMQSLVRRRWFARGANFDDKYETKLKESIPSATELHDAGVKFKIKRAYKRNPFEIEFNNGVMQIPTCNANDLTESCYRNLIVYEQYFQEGSSAFFGCHARLMDNLIPSREDVMLMRSYGILCDDLGHHTAVTAMFNNIVNHVCVSLRDTEYAPILDKVNAHCRRRRHRWMAKLRGDYFSNPWSLISFLAAFLLLMLTITQTVCSILSVD